MAHRSWCVVRGASLMVRRSWRIAHGACSRRSMEHRPGAEVDLAHLRVAAHFSRRRAGDDAAPIQHHDGMSMPEDDIHVVLGEQYRDAALPDDVGNELHQREALAE